MKRVWARHGARWLLGILFTLLAVLQVAHFPSLGFIDRFDLFLYDLRLRTQNAPLDDRVVIVDIDEKSLDKVGRWPWSRDVVARLVETLDQQYFARSIGFDVIFSEADTSSGYETLAALADNELRDVPGFARRVQALKPRFDYDGRLAGTLKERPVARAACLRRPSIAAHWKGARWMPLSSAAIPATWNSCSSRRVPGAS
jgi:adenylate cyclase